MKAERVSCCLARMQAIVLFLCHLTNKPLIIAIAVPNGQIIVKMERILGVKLPRPGKKPTKKISAAEGAKKGGVVRGGPPKRR